MYGICIVLVRLSMQNKHMRAWSRQRTEHNVNRTNNNTKMGRLSGRVAFYYWCQCLYGPNALTQTYTIHRCGDRRHI